MRILLLAALIVLMGIGGADARRRHHHRGTDVQFASPTVEPAFENRQNTARLRRQPPTVASLVPGNWVLEQQNPDWNGKRFLSPDGTSWLAIYKVSAEEEPIADHMRSIVFAKDETITYLKGERTWVAVSGFKESRIFYRKAILACAGKAWHHVAFEYPAELKTRMDAFVLAVAQALDSTESNCDQSAAVNRP